MRLVTDPEPNIVQCPFCGSAQVAEEEDYSFWPSSASAFVEAVHCPACGKPYNLFCRPVYEFDAKPMPEYGWEG